MNQCSFMRIKPYLIIVIIISPFVCRVILIKTLLNSMQAKVINSAIQKLVFMRIVCYDRTRSVNVNCLLIAIRTYPDRYQVLGTHGRHFSMYHQLSFFRHAFVRYLRLEIPTVCQTSNSLNCMWKFCLYLLLQLEKGNVESLSLI